MKIFGTPRIWIEVVLTYRVDCLDLENRVEDYYLDPNRIFTKDKYESLVNYKDFLIK